MGSLGTRMVHLRVDLLVGLWMGLPKELVHPRMGMALLLRRAGLVLRSILGHLLGPGKRGKHLGQPAFYVRAAHVYGSFRPYYLYSPSRWGDQHLSYSPSSYCRSFAFKRGYWFWNGVQLAFWGWTAEHVGQFYGGWGYPFLQREWCPAPLTLLQHVA